MLKFISENKRREVYTDRRLDVTSEKFKVPDVLYCLTNYVIEEQRNVFTKKSNIATVTYYYGYIILALFN